MSQMISPDQWMAQVGEVSGITTEELDGLGRDYQAKYSKYEEAKKVASGLLEAAEEAEKKLMSALELAGKQKYHVDGLGLFFFVNKFVVKTPKTNGDKKLLFNWLKKKRGAEFLMTVTSINHQTLQSLYKAEYEAAVEENPEKSATFHLPGLEAPTNMQSLSFRREKA